MESRIIQSLVVLGVPGVALGVLYLLLEKFGFEFSTIDSTDSAIIAILFLLIVGGITIFALHRWAPQKSSNPNVTDASKNTLKNNREFHCSINTKEELSIAIHNLSKTNRTLLLEVASSPDGQYVNDLVISDKLNLSRGEIVYRGKELESKGFLDIRDLTDKCFEISNSILDIVEHDMKRLKLLLESRGKDND